MDAEKVMQIIGSQGKYHVILGTLLSMTLMNLAINNLTMVIYGYAPPHRFVQFANTKRLYEIEESKELISKP